LAYRTFWANILFYACSTAEATLIAFFNAGLDEKNPDQTLFSASIYG
jgi:hypothetical protein